MKNRIESKPVLTASDNGYSESSGDSTSEEGLLSLAKSEALSYKDLVERWISEHPAASLAAALGVGVTIGWLVKRT